LQLFRFRWSLLLSAVCLFLHFNSQAQIDTNECPVKVSVITCGTGEDLYTYFGHTAVRIQDSLRNIDVVFNYGTFDFDDPNFYYKFAQGKLLYFLSAENFPDFKEEYVEDHRSLTEQVINVTCQDKMRIENFLINNYLPQNRYYKYDFFFDNCTTRVRNIFSNLFGDSLNWNNKAYNNNVSFRQTIRHYLKKAPWTDLGINILLGGLTDQKMTANETMFLPDSLMYNLGNATVNGRPLVKKTINLYTPPPGNSTGFTITPFMVMVIILLLVILYTWKSNHMNANIVIMIDGILFFLIGVLGIFFLLMWFDTDHIMTKDNYNLLWAFPLDFVFAFLLPARKKIIKSYAGIAAIICSFYLVFGWFLPQKPLWPLVPLMIAIIIRLIAIYRLQFPYSRLLINK
jgi:Domain of unknown function (DUF4105)